MSKGIIVVDLPGNCGFCDFNALCGDGKQRCGVGSIGDIIDGYEDSIPDFCPIQPMPAKKKKYGIDSRRVKSYKNGWNACIDELIGGSDG